MTLFRKLTRRSSVDVLLTGEAFLLLALFRLCLAAVPVRRIIRTITRGHRPAAAQPSPSQEEIAQALRVRWAVEASTRNSAAKFVCFPQTLAGYVMLQRRKVASVIVYGVTRSADGQLIAHTWLELGDRVVLGGEGSGAFTPIDRWT